MVYIYKQQKVFSIRENFSYFDINQNLVFTARGSFFGFPKRYHLFSGAGQQPIIEVTRPAFAMMPRFLIKDLTSGRMIGKVKKRFRFFGRPRFDVFSADGGVYRIEGSFWAHNFKIFDPLGRQIIDVQKKVISWGDTYEIMIDDRFVPVPVAMALVLAIDCAVHSNR